MFAGQGVQVGAPVILQPVDTPAQITEDEVAYEGRVVASFIDDLQPSTTCNERGW